MPDHLPDRFVFRTLRVAKGFLPAPRLGPKVHNRLRHWFEVIAGDHHAAGKLQTHRIADVMILGTPQVERQVG